MNRNKKTKSNFISKAMIATAGVVAVTGTAGTSKIQAQAAGISLNGAPAVASSSEAVNSTSAAAQNTTQTSQGSSVGINQTGTALISDVNSSTGDFNVRVSNVYSLFQIVAVRVSVWQADDQSDLTTADAVLQDDGTYLLSDNVVNHGRHFGTYHASVSYVYDSGNEVTLDEATADIEPENYVYTEQVTPSESKVHVLNPSEGTTSVTVSSWSDANGQDDLVSTQATDNGSGDWSAVVDSSDHPDSGAFTSDIYAIMSGASENIGTVSYSLASETYKNTWHLNNGVNYHYDADGYTDQEVQLTEAQKRIIANAASNRSAYGTHNGYCAQWVRGVYASSGVSFDGTNAFDFWRKWSSSGSTDFSNIPPGAAVISTGYSSYGHVGIYLGNGQVAEDSNGFKIVSLSYFINRNTNHSMHGYSGWVGWVWPGGQMPQ